MDEIEQEDSAWQEEVRRQRRLIEEENAAAAKFAVMDSPTAMSDAASGNQPASKPKGKVTAADYFS
jgi:hypothetical protein